MSRARVLVALSLVTALAATGCSGDDGPSIVVYNAQHEQLLEEIAPAVHREDRHRGRAAQRRRRRAVRPAGAGGRRVPGRRVPHRELPGHVGRREARGSSRRSTTRRPSRSRAVPPRERAVDRLRGPVDGARLQHQPGLRGRPAGLDHRPRRPRVRRDGLVLAHGRRLPGDRRGRPRPRGRGRDAGVAGRPEGQRHRVRRQQRGARVGERRASRAIGIEYHYYWYRDQAESGENSDNSQLYFFGNHDPGAFLSISGAGVLKSSDNPDEAQQFVEFLTSEEGQQATRRQLRAGVPPQPGRQPGPAGQAALGAPAPDRRASPTSTVPRWST